MSILSKDFFDCDPIQVAKRLLGKVIRVRRENLLLSVRIIETEAYCLNDKASHASLGYTEKRKALFMPAGTIYMYYARGGDSLNISCRGEGNAVLIKSAFPYQDGKMDATMLHKMQQLNPLKSTCGKRPIAKLCNGQTLLCKSLGLRVPQWNGKTFNENFFMEDVGFSPEKIIATTRLGIPEGRDEHLMYRFIDYSMAKFTTSNPLTKKNWRLEREYSLIYL